MLTEFNSMNRKARWAYQFAGIILCVLVALFSAPRLGLASPQSDLQEADKEVQAANAAYDQALYNAQDLERQVNDLSSNVESKKQHIESMQESLKSNIKQSYMLRASTLLLMNVIADDSQTSLSDVLHAVSAYAVLNQETKNSIENASSEERALQEQLSQLSECKTEADSALNEAQNAKENALDAQEEARQKVKASQVKKATSSASPNSYFNTSASNSNDSEESAKAWIVQKESGGNYNARNGKYIGAYQLTDSYLGGDYSPSNQDRVANNYVSNRYGSWADAKRFWQSHGWY